MRPPFLLLVSLLAPADPASAQVTVDLRALDALPATRPAITRPAPNLAPRTRPQTASTSAGTSGTAAHAAATPSAQASAAATGTQTATAAGSNQAPASPATSTAGSAAAAPAATLPRGAPPAEPTGAASPTLHADASPTPAAAEAPTGPVAAAVRVMFAPGQGELGADGASVIKELVASAPKGDGTTYNVVAYAAATPDDPSTARRLSLSRALAVRNVLMGAGVPSSRIYVRALGGQTGDGPADRADVSVLGGNAPPPASAKPQ
ncbi:MAG: hypothetical protein BGO51_14060 [Rhodospirillales bacterium 69-11]|nr:MAG: hypothetical protein BGO51_14060 [Rhodospirillales bacterium 69-11]